MLEDQIKTSNENDISTNIIIVRRYTRIIHILIISSKILIIISGLLSFASTRFESIWMLNSSSGSLNFLSTSLLSYSSFLTLERKKIVKNLNSKLQILGIKDKLLISENESNDSDKSS